MCNSKIQIPPLNREHSLVSVFIPKILTGTNNKYDDKSELYLRLFIRLVDKSYNEYIYAKEYLEKEIKTNDKLAYRFNIINHLENCLNAINRVIKTFDIILNGIKDKSKNSIYKDENVKLLDNIGDEVLSKMKDYSVSKLRNRVEHINEDIYKDRFGEGLFLDVDVGYKNVYINKKQISLIELTEIIQNYYLFVLELV